MPVYAQQCRRLPTNAFQKLYVKRLFSYSDIFGNPGTTSSSRMEKRFLNDSKLKQKCMDTRTRLVCKTFWLGQYMTRLFSYDTTRRKSHNKTRNEFRLKISRNVRDDVEPGRIYPARDLDTTKVFCSFRWQTLTSPVSWCAGALPRTT